MLPVRRPVPSFGQVQRSGLSDLTQPNDPSTYNDHKVLQNTSRIEETRFFWCQQKGASRTFAQPCQCKSIGDFARDWLLTHRIQPNDGEFKESPFLLPTFFWQKCNVFREGNFKCLDFRLQRAISSPKRSFTIDLSWILKLFGFEISNANLAKRLLSSAGRTEMSLNRRLENYFWLSMSEHSSNQFRIISHNSVHKFDTRSRRHSRQSTHLEL